MLTPHRERVDSSSSHFKVWELLNGTNCQFLKESHRHITLVDWHILDFCVLSTYPSNDLGGSSVDVLHLSVLVISLSIFDLIDTYSVDPKHAGFFALPKMIESPPQILSHKPRPAVEGYREHDAVGWAPLI